MQAPADPNDALKEGTGSVLDNTVLMMMSGMNGGNHDGLDLPILVGASRKHFLLHETAEETKFATAAAVAASILNGAHLVRVHDVREMRVVAEVCDEVLQQNLPKERTQRD